MHSLLSIIVWSLLYHPTLDEQVEWTKDTNMVRYMDANSTINYEPVEKDLRIYCHRGELRSLMRLFESIELQLEIKGDDYTEYNGATPEEVNERYEEQRSLFSLNVFTLKSHRIQLSPFEQQCIGIETIQPYSVHLHQLKIDHWRVIQFLMGVMLFFYAGHLSNKSLFYYIIGIIFGIGSSFLLLIWLSGVLIPERTVMRSALVGSWVVGFCILRTLWKHLDVVLLTYYSYVCLYVLIISGLSFYFCYRWGPPKDHRSKNIIKLLIQLVSLVLIYFSSHLKNVTVVIIVDMAMLYYIPWNLLIIRRFGY